MDYLCAYYWQQEGEKVSLVLKQLVLHDGGVPVVFGCMAEGGKGNFFTEKMTEWFHNSALLLCRRREEDTKVLEKSLLRQISDIPRKPKSAMVLLCVGNLFFLWGKGQQRIWLLNTRFGRPHHRCLLDAGMVEDGEIVSGSLECGVGILAADESFLRKLTGEQIVNCLMLKELNQETKLQKRLKELGEAAARKGEKHLGAMLIVTC